MQPDVTKLTYVSKIFVKNSSTKFHINPPNWFAADTRSQSDCGMLRSSTNVSGQPTGPTFKSQAVHDPAWEICKAQAVWETYAQMGGTTMGSESCIHEGAGVLILDKNDSEWVPNAGSLTLMKLVLFFCFGRDSPTVVQGLLIHEVSGSHTTAHHSR
jgi:hypothetical protein